MMLAVAGIRADHVAVDGVRVASPSGKVQARIMIDAGRVTYSVLLEDRIVIDRAQMGIVVDNLDYSQSTMDAAGVSTQVVDQTYPMLGVKSAARNHYVCARIPLVSGAVGAKWTLEARVFDDGFAFRYILPGAGARTIQKETTSFTLPEGSAIWYFERNNKWKLQSYAGEWLRAPLAAMSRVSKMGPVQGLPLVGELPRGGYVVLTEAACWNYSSLRCKAVGSNTFLASLADDSFVLRDEIVTPWRVVLCVQDLNAMVNSTLVNNLAPAPDARLYADTSYIKPGRSVWRWWSSGTGSPQEERAYVDHAVELGYEYTTVDEGWEKWPETWATLGDLCGYAREKKVGVIVWKHSKEIMNPSGNWKEMRAFFDKVKAAGAVGMKIDFMNSDGKTAIDFEIAALRLAAERKLLVNFHGCHKATGEARSYPNEVTREGIRGLELNKMKEGPLSASHNAALPFTRFIAGHADYTPFTITPSRLGPTTVSHQLATVVCFTSPLQTIAENPARMLESDFEGLTSVLKRIPSVWDETKVLPGSKIGDLAVMARRKGDTWFVAALNGSGRRNHLVNLLFLGEGKYHAVWIQDSPDSPARFKVVKRPIDRQEKIELPMNEGGGFVMLLEPAEAPLISGI